MRKKLLRKLPKLTYQLDLFSDLDKRKRYYEAQTAVNHYLYIEIKKMTFLYVSNFSLYSFLRTATEEHFWIYDSDYKFLTKGFWIVGCLRFLMIAQGLCHEIKTDIFI